MTIFRSAKKSAAPIIGFVVLTMGYTSMATAQTFVATRLNGNEPLIDSSTFSDVGAEGGNSINGPSVIRVPDWIPELRASPSERKILHVFLKSRR